MQTDVEAVVTRWDNIIVRNNVTIPMRDFTVVTGTQNDNIAFRLRRHRAGGNFSAIAGQRVAVTARRRVSPISAGAVGKGHTTVKGCSRRHQAGQHCTATPVDPQGRNFRGNCSFVHVLLPPGCPAGPELI